MGYKSESIIDELSSNRIGNSSLVSARVARCGVCADYTHPINEIQLPR
jgi:hypothetical protein